MELILWRHAEAVDAEGSMLDLERPLTKHGRKQAKRIAGWLKDHLPDDCRILVSPARRTRETVEPLGRAHEIEPAIAPGASARSLLRAAGWPGQPGAVLLVGHQPTLGDAAGHVLGGKDLALSVRKGALWWITGRERGSRVEAVLRAVVDPDLL